MLGVQNFLGECCVEDWQAEQHEGALWRAYTDWCERHALDPQPPIGFMVRLQEKGFVRVRRGDCWYWGGVGLRRPMAARYDRLEPYPFASQAVVEHAR